MSKLIAFVGSPRKEGNIYTLVNRMIEGAKDFRWYSTDTSGTLKNL